MLLSHVEHGGEWPDINGEEGEFRLGTWSEESVFYSQYELSASCSKLPCDNPYIYIYRLYTPGPLSMAEPDWDFVAIKPESLRKLVERKANLSKTAFDEMGSYRSRLKTGHFLKEMDYRDALEAQAKAAASGEYPTQPLCNMNRAHDDFCKSIGADPSKMTTLGIMEWSIWYRENKK